MCFWCKEGQSDAATSGQVHLLGLNYEKAARVLYFY